MALTADDYSVALTMDSRSDLPADGIVNTFAIKRTTGDPDWTAVLAAFVTGYTNGKAIIGGGALKLGALNMSMKVFALSDPLPRSPVADLRGTIPWTAQDAYPQEVAICSSFAAAGGSGINAARRRGRVYLGPIATSAGSLGSDSYTRPSEAAQGSAQLIVVDIALGLAAAGFDLCVWSRADNSLFPVVRGWVNNEFDTQRRRGPKPTSRTTWTVAP